MPAFLSYNIIIELICFLVALITLRKDRSSWRLMIGFLAIVVLTEVTGRQITLAHMSNHWLYNIFLLFEAGLVGYMFYFLLQKRKGLVLAGLFVFITAYLLEGYFNGFTQFFDLTNLVSSTIFITLALYYYYLLLNQNEFYNLMQYAPFWWVTGALFFYFGGTVCNIFFNYLTQLTSSELGIPLRYYIFNILNMVLYSCWAYAFVCRWREMQGAGRPVALG